MAIQLNTIIPEELAGKRLDQALAGIFTDYSREVIKSWILSGECLVDSEIWRPKDKINGGEQVEVLAAETAVANFESQNIPLDIIYEDSEILVINKPANLVVHPGVGNLSGTLVNALLYYAPELKSIPRAGIVHRLDKDTTGLLVVAKTLPAHKKLIEQLQDRSMQRTYQALVWGVFPAGGMIDQPIGRHKNIRTKMAVVNNGKPAVTHYRVLKKYSQHTLLNIKLETGRTHQIRVHMAYLRHPIVGDKTYGGRPKFPANASRVLLTALEKFPRQALHAVELGLIHPSSNKFISWQVPLADDLKKLLELL